MESWSGREPLMKRIAVIVGVVAAVAATPTVVTASNSKSPAKYDIAKNRSSSLGPLYGPVKVAPGSYGYLSR
jgi:hypothetical protein